MGKLKIKMENCYGIGSLACCFDFAEHQTVAIYAPNGSMKTSFAKAFEDASKDKPSEDLVFSDRETVRDILWSDQTMPKEKIFVVHPIVEQFKSEKISMLMVNNDLRREYETIFAQISEKKEDLLHSLVAYTGLKKVEDIEKEICTATSVKGNDIMRGLGRLMIEVMNEDKSKFSDIIYSEIFNDKVLPIIEKKEMQNEISEYMAQLDRLIEESKFFRKGVFNHDNAGNIATELEKNGFFKAEHYVTLRQQGGENVTINTKKELVSAINAEKDKIFKNPDLLKAFEGINKILNKNQSLRDFRNYIEENQKIIPELANLREFRMQLWADYLKAKKDEFKELMDIHQKAQARLKEITEQADKQRTRWNEVIDIYNRRFDVPFRVTVDNKTEVMLGDVLVPVFKFEFHGGRHESKVMGENDLVNLRVLSQGETRALYLLNIIYEIEARKESSQETLFIIDDIADSFDYKNKYAILEYLYEMSKEEIFYQIILTHNFDFYRSVSSRIIDRKNRKNKCTIEKDGGNVKIVEEHYQNNPFNYWRKHLHIHMSMLIASIPFARNIAEYCGQRDIYKKLTSFVHMRPETSQLKISCAVDLLKEVLKFNSTPSNLDKFYIAELYEVADKSCDEQESFVLENKVVLSMAIRLKAERAMIAKINDESFVENIKENQTRALFDKYKELFPECPNVKMFEHVNLLTPENIHINSFMYEPILDMSDSRLKKLYKEVSELCPSQP